MYRLHRWLFCIVAAMSTVPSHAAVAQPSDPQTSTAGERVVELLLAAGTKQRLLYVRPGHPVATIVMLPGGAGDVGIEGDGDLRHGNNFVVRSRALWAARGFAVVIPDTIEQSNLRGTRSSPAYAAIVDDLIAFAQGEVKGPVFLLGTSQGAIAAMNGAAHAQPGALAGLVLTESVSRLGGSQETVFDADPAGVRVPVLIVANRDDRCNVAPPDDASRIAAALTNTRDVRVVKVSGGIDRSQRACGSLSPHGYYGIEGEVVGRIVGWMYSHH
jgi:pimeloyl-ACP methyl ester carboxylesterase